MTTTLLWSPVTDYSGTLSEDLKRILARKYLDHDGSLSGTAVLDNTELPYLEGLADAGITSAAKLVKLIKKHGAIELPWQN